MHELAITEGILNIATEHASKSNAARVTDIYLVIGRLSSIVDDSVQFYWDFVSKDTICQGSTLHFTTVPARLSCMDCQQEYTLDGELSACPSCSSSHIRVLSGEEFYLDSIAIEVESATEKG
jgi:hydrogenase nickel incorporation protein HypA/HybF